QRKSLPMRGMETREADQNRPLRLDAAAERYFGADSGISGKSLRRLARKGKLRTFRIANKTFTTLAAIAEMVEGASEPAPPDPNTAKPRPPSAVSAVARAAQAIASIGEAAADVR